MIVKLEQIKSLCNTILQAVDTSDVSLITTTLQIKQFDSKLHFSVTNKEYYVEFTLESEDNSNFYASVNATSFLKLISQFTSEYVEFNVIDNTLEIRGNGLYKLPLIYDGENLLELPDIPMTTIDTSFNVDSAILQSIYTYNSKEVTKDTAVTPIQRLFYLDKTGCVTFSSGACVNKFELPTSVPVLLNLKLVKLFKLFFKQNMILCEIGHDTIGSITQTKIRLTSENITLTAILVNNETYISNFPIAAIRNKTFLQYPYSISINISELSQIINRLISFTTSTSNSTYTTYSTVEFRDNHLILSNSKKEYSEELSYISSTDESLNYSAVVDLKNLKSALESYSEQYIQLEFGDHEAIVITNGNVYTLIPEASL